MEILVKASWAVLALVHLSPAAATFAPCVISRIYGVQPDGDLGMLLSHRGALFLSILAACVWAMFDAAPRRAIVVVVAVSIIGFLILYTRAGAPTGPLRRIAIVDALALIPLLVVAVSAWRIRSAAV